MRIKDLHNYYKRLLRSKDDQIIILNNVLNDKNKEIEMLKCEEIFDFNNISIFVQANKIMRYDLRDKVSINLKIDNVDGYYECETYIDNDIFKFIKIDKGKVITEVIGKMVRKILNKKYKDASI